MATSGGGPQRIGDILRERIDALGWGQRLREEEVVTGWEAAVGPQIAAHARPSHVSNRRLTVVTESPVWTQQLSLLKPDLMRRITRTFGAGLVTELFFVTGEIGPAPGDAPAPAAPARPAGPPPAIPEPLRAELEAIGDEGVREAVRRLILASLAADGER